MNAQRRLEEFIFKLITAQNNRDHLGFTNEVKRQLNLERHKIKWDKGNEKIIESRYG